jgi:hypothetical protein
MLRATEIGQFIEYIYVSVDYQTVWLVPECTAEEAGDVHGPQDPECMADSLQDDCTEDLH